MGLDISVYKNLKIIDKTKINFDKDEQDDYLEIYDQDFKKQLDGSDLIIGEYYDYDYAKEFRAGSYSGYNYWRNELAKLAGYESDVFVWENVEDGVFVELINFSDCDGIIGSKISKKLYNDFCEFDNTASLKDGGFYYIYKEFKEAFKIASENNGCVLFH